MIFVAMSIRANTGKADDLAQAMAAMMAETRTEEGCVTYTYSRDLAEDDLFHLCEMWVDVPLMEAHIDAPHSAIFIGALQHLGRIQSVKSFGGEVEKHRIRAPSHPA